MIQQKTCLKVVDNSGAKKVRCIKVLGGFKRMNAGVGDVIVVSVQQLRSTNKHNSKVAKGDITRALVIRTKKGYKKKDGSQITLFSNAVILLNKQRNLIGTRILTALPKLLKKKKFVKYLSLCPGTF